MAIALSFSLAKISNKGSNPFTSTKGLKCLKYFLPALVPSSEAK